MRLTPRVGPEPGSSGLTIITSSNPRRRFTLPLPLDAARRHTVAAADDVELPAARLAREQRWSLHEVDVRAWPAAAAAVGAVDHAFEPADPHEHPRHAPRPSRLDPDHVTH